ncbi:MAG: M28 family peptidase [Gemmataceae bacterium]|nr:M28 family peptidase [Gemmataceae bacterium]
MLSLSWHRRRPVIALVGLLLLVGVGPAAEEDPVEARMKKDITYLASDECEGRGVETKGINKAADYIAAEFKKAGLTPGVDGKSYFQPFNMTGTSKLEGNNTLVLTGPQGQQIELVLHKQFRPLGLSGAGKVSAPVVFIGYGAKTKDIGYDDFKGVDVKDKVVVILRKTPRFDNPNTPFDGGRQAQHAALAEKLVNAADAKAAAVLFVNDRNAAGDPLIDFAQMSFGGRVSDAPVIHVRRSVVDAMLQSSAGTNLKDIEQDIDRDLKPRSADLTGWTATLETGVRRPKLDVKNVVGILEGSGPLAKETIVIGAHYDHLGYGNHSSLAKGLKQPTIHFGADDNGSGTTALIELARRFGAKGKREGRRLVFVGFSGEESGLIGSANYCKKPVIPLADTAAMVNLDMVGRLRPDPKTKKDKLEVHGTGTSKSFDDLIEALNENYGFQLNKRPGGMGPSDHQSFYQQKVPVFFFFTGDHPDYHRPSDTADKINVAGMRRITDLTEDLVSHLRTVADRPQYVAVSGGTTTGSFSGPRLGIMPNYDDEGPGVLLNGVSDGGPASKAGLKTGDRIIEIEGQAVRNFQTYMTVISRHKRGDTINLTIQRDNKKMNIKVATE